MHARPTMPIFQAMARPMMVPMMRVPQDWTIAPSVTPARPSIFSGLSLRPDVREPVYKAFVSAARNHRFICTYAVLILIKVLNYRLVSTPH